MRKSLLSNVRNKKYRKQFADKKKKLFIGHQVLHADATKLLIFLHTTSNTCFSLFEFGFHFQYFSHTLFQVLILKFQLGSVKF